MRGTLLDCEGRAVAGAAVRAGIRESEFLSITLLRSYGTTDNRGAFEIGPLREDEEYAVAVLPREATRWHLEQPLKGGAEFRIELPEPQRLVVDLVDTRGRAVPHADLRLAPAGALEVFAVLACRLAPPLRPARTTRPGRLELDGLYPGEYVLLGRAPDGRIASVEFEIENRALETRLVFTAEPAVEVHVVDAVRGRPIEGALVALVCGDRDAPSVDRARTDAGGSVRLFPAAQDEEGESWIRVDHPAWPVTYRQLEPGAERFTVAIAPAASIHGHVVGLARPQERLIVSLSAGDTFPRRDELDLPRFAAVDAAGGFRFRNLPPGTWEFELLACGREQRGVQDPDGGVRLAQGVWMPAAGEQLDVEVEIGAGEDG
jgi:hypothetical protein